MKSTKSEPLTLEQIDDARRYTVGELERCNAELGHRLNAMVDGMARRGVGVLDDAEAAMKLQAQITVLRAAIPRFDDFAARFERERAIAIAGDRLAELDVLIPAAVAAREAAENEPQPPSVGGNGLRARDRHNAMVAGHQANCRQLENERAELQSKVALLRGSDDATSEDAA